MAVADSSPSFPVRWCCATRRPRTCDCEQVERGRATSYVGSSPHPVEQQQRLLSAAPIVGLTSIDFLVDGHEFHLLEVNPRPGATLDIFEPRDGSLFALHVAACEGTLPPTPPSYDDAAASAVVYADEDIASIPAMEWPSWIADRPCVGASIKAGGPLCTVLAFASIAAAARALVEQRIAFVLADLNARVS